MTGFPTGFSDRQVCILGMGYVGLTLATVMSEVGFQVTGVEIRRDVVDRLRDGISTIHEPGIGPRLRRQVEEGRLCIESSLSAPVEASVYIITVGTPLDEGGRARMDMVESVSHEVAAVLRPGDLVVMRSTVKLGTTRDVVLPILESAGVEFDLAVCPERTLEGQALTELRRLPQIVGGLSHDASARAAQVFQFLTPTVVRVHDIETAEMIKMVDNAQRDAIFGLSNEVARLCDAAGISALEVIEAGKLGYPRTNLPLPGPVGGPCLSKDPYILAESFERFGVKPEIVMAARAINERQPIEVADYIADVVSTWPLDSSNMEVALLGLAFKGRPATDDLRGTMAVPIRAALEQVLPGARFRGYDPEVAKDATESLGLVATESIEAAFSGSHLALILTNHDAFSSMLIEELAESLARPAVIYDFWNLFVGGELDLPSGVGYAALGNHGRAAFPVLGP